MLTQKGAAEAAAAAAATASSAAAGSSTAGHTAQATALACLARRSAALLISDFLHITKDPRKGLPQVFHGVLRILDHRALRLRRTLSGPGHRRDVR